MTETQKHTGGCHCGKIRYEVTLNASQGISCNCSICAKRGHVLAFAPANAFTLLSGEDVIHDYQFGKKVVHHRFCGNCGVGSYGNGQMPDGTKMVAINLRCLDGLDLSTVKINLHDGKSR